MLLLDRLPVDVFIPPSGFALIDNHYRRCGITGQESRTHVLFLRFLRTGNGFDERVFLQRHAFVRFPVLRSQVAPLRVEFLVSCPLRQLRMRRLERLIVRSQIEEQRGSFRRHNIVEPIGASALFPSHLRLLCCVVDSLTSFSIHPLLKTTS